MKSRRRSRVTRVRSQFLQRSQRSMSNIRNKSRIQRSSKRRSDKTVNHVKEHNKRTEYNKIVEEGKKQRQAENENENAKIKKLNLEPGEEEFYEWYDTFYREGEDQYPKNICNVYKRGFMKHKFIFRAAKFLEKKCLEQGGK